MATSSSSADKKATSQIEKTVSFCPYCEASDDHSPEDCTVVIDLGARKQMLKSSGRCFQCINHGHTVQNCPQKVNVCMACLEYHHISICEDNMDYWMKNFKFPVIGVDLAYVGDEDGTGDQRSGKYRRYFKSIKKETSPEKKPV